MFEEEWKNCRQCGLAFPELHKDGLCDICTYVMKDRQKTITKWLKNE